MQRFAHFHFLGFHTTLDLTALAFELSYEFCSQCNLKALNSNNETKEPNPFTKNKKIFSSEFPLKGVYQGSGSFFAYLKKNNKLGTKTQSIFFKLTLTVVQEPSFHLTMSIYQLKNVFIQFCFVKVNTLKTVTHF